MEQAINTLQIVAMILIIVYMVSLISYFIFGEIGFKKNSKFASVIGDIANYISWIAGIALIGVAIAILILVPIYVLNIINSV